MAQMILWFFDQNNIVAFSSLGQSKTRLDKALLPLALILDANAILIDG